MIRRFTAYRHQPPEGYVEGGYANPPDQPQFEGAVFTDGTVVVRWLTEHRSHSVWTSFEEMLAVHGHPEYGSRIEFHDPLPGQGDHLHPDDEFCEWCNPAPQTG